MTMSESDAPARSIPANVEAERAVLGSLMIDPDAIIKIANFLRAEDFFRERHAWLYEAMYALHERREPLDFVTLVDELERHSRLSEIGGPAYLTDLIASTPTALYVDHYARIVERTAVLRRLIAAAGKIAELAYDESLDVDEVVDRSEQIVFGVTESRIHRDLTPIRAIMTNVVDHIDFLSRNQDRLMGVPTGFTMLDRLLGGFQKSDLIILAARPGMGKCVATGTRLLDPATGLLLPIEQLVANRQANLLTLNSEYKLVPTQASDFLDNGIKPVYRVRTSLGREIKVTQTHPFLTIRGWLPLDELAVGDKIAIPRALPVFGQTDPPSHEAKLLAYMIADGCMTRTNPHFINSNPRLLDEFAEEVSHFIGVKTRYEDDKVVPDFIFGYTKPKMALFLNRLFACDGSLYLQNKTQPAISYSTVSKQLAQDVQHLLLRFGIISKLRHRQINYNDGQRRAYELRITDATSVKCFCLEIGAFGKEEAATKLLAQLQTTTRNVNVDVVPIEIWEQILAIKGDQSWRSLYDRMGLPPESNLHAGKRAPSRRRLQQLGEALNSQELMALAQSDLYWDKIIEIEYLGEERVYDLTVPQTHNFVADDIVVHNSSFGLSVAQNAAKRHNARVAFFCLEMSNEQMVQRLLAMETGIDSHRLRMGAVHEEEWPVVLEAANLLANTSVFIDDTPAASVTDIRTKCRRLYAEHGLDMIIVDYMQLMTGQTGSRNDNRQQEISFISRSLKALARELNVPVIALSQLSRAVESRADKRPMLSDLRESGSIEQDADAVLFIYREDYYIEDTDRQNIADILVAKHRHGATGTVSLFFRKELMQFRDLEIQRTDLDY